MAVAKVQVQKQRARLVRRQLVVRQVTRAPVHAVLVTHLQVAGGQARHIPARLEHPAHFRRPLPELVRHMRRRTEGHVQLQEVATVPLRALRVAEAGVVAKVVRAAQGLGVRPLHRTAPLHRVVLEGARKAAQVRRQAHLKGTLVLRKDAIRVRPLTRVAVDPRQLPVAEVRVAE